MKNEVNGTLARFIQICYQVAAYADERGEAGDNFTLDPFGLGFRAFSHYMREGIKAVLDLEQSYKNMFDREKYARMDRDSMKEFMVDIFGDEDAHTFNDDIKERMRALVREINKEYEEEGEEE